LVEVLGKSEAATMMEHIPIGGWASIATKDDLRQLELRLGGKMESLESRLESKMETLDARSSARSWRIAVAVNVPAVMAAVALAYAASRF
jgi:hypothetical protein